MSSEDERGVCANCGRERPIAEIDSSGWCGSCRREVVRRATVIAHLIGGVAAIAVGIWIITVVRPGPRFVVVWFLLVGAIYYFLYKLARRVAFEVVRGRGVRPAKEE